VHDDQITYKVFLETISTGSAYRQSVFSYKNGMQAHKVDHRVERTMVPTPSTPQVYVAENRRRGRPEGIFFPLSLPLLPGLLLAGPLPTLLAHLLLNTVLDVTAGTRHKHLAGIIVCG
jgi:hypothetical protein